MCLKEGPLSLSLFCTSVMIAKIVFLETQSVEGFSLTEPQKQISILLILTATAT